MEILPMYNIKVTKIICMALLEKAMYINIESYGFSSVDASNDDWLLSENLIYIKFILLEFFICDNELVCRWKSPVSVHYA